MARRNQAGDNVSEGLVWPVVSPTTQSRNPAARRVATDATAMISLRLP
jgi:hypothetical protein